MLQIDVELISGIGLFGKCTCGVKRVPEVCRGSESFCFACEIQVEPEERMIGEIPEGWVIRLFLIAPEALLPQRGGAGHQGVFQHIDGRAELPPHHGAPRRLHRGFIHNVSSFFLLFSTYYHQKRSEPTLISLVSSSRGTFLPKSPVPPLSRIIWEGSTATTCINSHSTWDAGRGTSLLWWGARVGGETTAALAFPISISSGWLPGRVRWNCTSSPILLDPMRPTRGTSASWWRIWKSTGTDWPRRE